MRQVAARVVGGAKGQAEDRWILAMHASSQRDRHMVDDIFEENEAQQCVCVDRRAGSSACRRLTVGRGAVLPLPKYIPLPGIPGTVASRAAVQGS